MGQPAEGAGSWEEVEQESEIKKTEEQVNTSATAPAEPVAIEEEEIVPFEEAITETPEPAVENTEAN